jgi:hypothetical protein
MSRSQGLVMDVNTLDGYVFLVSIPDLVIAPLSEYIVVDLETFNVGFPSLHSTLILHVRNYQISAYKEGFIYHDYGLWAFIML